MAAGEDQLEPLVGHHHRLLVLSALRRQLLQAGEQLRLARQGLLPSDPVDRAVAGRRDDPRTRVRRHAVARPSLDRGREGILHSVLGEVEVAEDAGEDGDRTRTLVPVGTGDLLYEAPPEWSTIGRISIVPPRAAGIRAAHSIASSRLSASTR